MRRQIIKTKPTRPYHIARIVTVVIILVLLVAIAYFVLHRQPARARQDSAITLRNSQSPAILTRGL